MNVPEPPESPRLFRPRTVGEILQHAFQLYVAHWGNLILTVALIVVPLTIVQAVLVDLVIDPIFRTSTRHGDVVVVSGSLAAGTLAWLAVGVFTVLMWTVLTGAITRAAAGTFLGRDMDVPESYRYGLARFWSIVLVCLLASLAIAGGFILLVIPGFFILTKLTVSLPTLVIEDKRGREALRRSWNLVTGFGWAVFGTIIVAGLATGLLSSIVTGLFGHNAVARTVGQCIASIITVPYTALVGILIYLDLRVRKERYGPEELERDLARSSAA